MTDYVIVGVDPGTTTAVAALDLGGRVVGAYSSKDMGVSQTVKHILSLGKPSVIASDVNPAPEFVSTIASQFGVRLFVPDKTLSVADKLDMSRPHDTQDAHQRDALAAAINAYAAYRKKLEKIESLGLPSEAAHLVLQGMSISAAKAKLEAKEEAPAPPPPEAPVADKELTPLERRVRDLERQVKALQETLEEKELEIHALHEELAREKRVQHTKQPVSSQGRMIAALSQRLGETGRTAALLRRAVSGEVLLVGAYPKVIGGLTLVEAVPGSMNGVSAAFTSKGKVREALSAGKVRVYDSKELQREGDYYYLTRKRMDELNEPPKRAPDLEGLIREYRQART
jgi:uncharacterized protein